MEIRLEPNLRSCIETVAKMEYERVLGLLLKKGQVERQLEQKFELLKAFLESADFGKLRSLSEGFLLNGRRVEFILKSTGIMGSYKIEMSQLKNDTGQNDTSF
ncbi:MAG: hypothetical protein JW882_04975 [Deltaproteobacteria bacterium]|nr:hypothetical protein [Deltaproteobacteria bacterium]